MVKRMPCGPKHAKSSLSAMIMLAGFSVVLALLIAELVARVAVPPLDFHFPTMRMTDERFTERAGKVMDGNGVRYVFDGSGFRTGDASAADAGRPAVLFIGDSFTQGFGVNGNETFPAVTCDRLATGGVSVSCLNAGVTGFGTAHELRLLQRLLERKELTFAAVVFQVLPNNDLRDNWEDGGFGVDGEHLVIRDPPRIPTAVRLRVGLFDNFFAHNSQLVKLAANAMFGGEGADPQYDGEAFELERHLLAEVVATTRGHRIPLVVVVCAVAWELNQTGSKPYDEAARLDLVATTVRTLHVPWIDSRTLAAAPADYIPSDGHFSVAGNAAMGNALAEALRPILNESRGLQASRWPV
jgi:lysophospholipase L1-like esterase